MAPLWPALATLLATAGASQVDPDSSALSYTGRWDFSVPKAPAFQWPLTSVGTHLTCTGSAEVLIQFTASEPLTALSPRVNGELTARALLKPGLRTVSVSVPPGQSTLEVAKDTEDFSADPTFLPLGQERHADPVYFHGLTVRGTCSLMPLPPKQRRMEFIGDSISCGFGNQGKPGVSGWAGCSADMASAKVLGQLAPFMVQTSTAHEAWAAKVAQAFDADMHLQCISGIGICKNGNNLFSKSTPFNMTRYIDRALPYKSGPVAWDYRRWQPDVLFVNLGTNDYDTSSVLTEPDRDTFERSYVKFVKHVMANYDARHTKVVLACGPMTNRQCDTVSRVAETLTREFHIIVKYIAVSISGSPNALNGCMDHPSLEEDSEVADLVIPVVKDFTGWDTPVSRAVLV